MALKYSFKLISLKFILEGMINTAPKASNSAYGREKCSKCNNFSGSIIQLQRGPVVWVFFEHFSLFSFRFFLSHFFPFASFPLSSLLTVFSFARFFCDNVFLVGQNKTFRERSYGIIKFFKITTEHCNSHL